MRKYQEFLDLVRGNLPAAPHMAGDDFRALESDLDHLLEEVRSQPSIGAAEGLLDELGELQLLLSILCFKYRLGLPERLRQFVRLYDRVDDPQVRRDVYREIKAGSFLIK
jgi:hypothetical protein